MVLLPLISHAQPHFHHHKWLALAKQGRSGFHSLPVKVSDDQTSQANDFSFARLKPQHLFSRVFSMSFLSELLFDYS